MTVTQRRDTVRKHEYCFNCLARSHSVWECTSKVACHVCSLQHHTLLHPFKHPRIVFDKPPAPAMHIKSRVAVVKRTSPTKPARSSDRIGQAKGRQSANRDPRDCLAKVIKAQEMLQDLI